jgi:hypothetical protein
MRAHDRSRALAMLSQVDITEYGLKFHAVPEMLPLRRVKAK